MPQELHIDIETYSSVDITKAGAYKYCESFDFEILLVAYAFGSGPIVIKDLLQGDPLPDVFINALHDPKIEKHAHNANFERLAFRAIGHDIPVEQWRCSAIKAAYCGYPLRLEEVSNAMKLQENGKLSTGKALIRYFCVPIKPTKANDHRLRNLPEHDLEKWEEFKRYCIGDVRAERTITNRLRTFTIPDQERALYNLDQQINDRGILIDLDMAQKAQDLDAEHTANLGKEIQEITGLENPNSPTQLKKWLSSAMQKEVSSLAKDELPKLISEAGPGVVSDVLELRQKASKTSNKKYTRMLDCACDSSRAHGLFQFYGANRTGRWAGRLIQMQNLPQNHLEDLEGARQAIKTGDYEVVTLCYDNASDVLSQLIRTAFIAPPGKIFAVADFSAIEARVIAWLAGEKWRLDVFETHGKIYEASASMMFGVPIEEVTKGSEYRQKGKIAELALGYQGSVGALTQMGGEEMGLSISEMKEIVSKWRNSNPEIVKLWKTVEGYAMRVIKTRKRCVVPALHNTAFDYQNNVLTIELPSGRKLFYQQAQNYSKTTQGPNGPWTREAIRYKGVDQQTKKWWIDSYGGKFVENIVQAIARDLLALAMIRLDKAGFEIVMHVHDEVVCEIDYDIAVHSQLEIMCDIMGQDVSWSPGLPLNADGYLTPFYKKD